MDFSSFSYIENESSYNYDCNYYDSKIIDFDLFSNNSINENNNTNNNNFKILNENNFLNKKINFSNNNEESNLNEIDESTFLSSHINLNINNFNNNYYENNENKKNNYNINENQLIKSETKKKFYNLNEEIISLMKQEKRPLEIDFIYNKLKDKKDFFRKKNGSKYNNDFKKSISYTLRSSGYFNKTYDNKYSYNDDNSIFLTKNKNFNLNFNLNCCKSLIPVEIKLQLNKVNNLIKKLDNKFKGDPKYVQIISMLDLFRNLLDKFLKLIKYKKQNSIVDLYILNEKIISICYRIEKMEKNEIFNENNEYKIERGKKNNNINNINNERNIFRFNGDNNVFTEPPTIF